MQSREICTIKRRRGDHNIRQARPEPVGNGHHRCHTGGSAKHSRTIEASETFSLRIARPSEAWSSGAFFNKKASIFNKVILA